MIVSTNDSIAGQRIVRTLGIVRGNTIRARHLGRDIMALGRNVVGGEISEYTKLLGEAREQALDRMVAEAKELGADAVVMTRFSTSMVMSGAAELLAYGTAVVLEPIQ
ncbi:MAG TPA: heavy metal-binding domain-containing protein [Actinobacteria bacterium]|nr:heavy metal-binding domain-containing protein [Actinomycetota bacterium]